MQCELRQVLRNQSHQTGIMRARRNLAEPHLIALDKQLNTKQTTTTQRFGNSLGHTLGLGQSNRAHGLRLPGLLIIALLLTVTDRCTEGSAANMAYGQKGDFVVKVDKAFNDNPALARTTAFLRVVPRSLYIVGAAQQALALARRTHHRLDHTRKAQVQHGGAVVFEGVGKVVRRGWQVQLFGCQATNAFAVHGQRSSAGSRDYVETFSFQLDQGGSGDGFDFRNDKVRLFCFDHGTQGGAIEHVDHVAAVGNLHGRCIGVAVNGDHFDPQTLQFDDNFFAQLTAATQHDAGRSWRQWSSDTGHFRSSRKQNHRRH